MMTLVRFLTLALLLSATTAAQAFDTAAREALLIDFETGAVLIEKDSDLPVPPASPA